jgi:hypothetical protein
MHQHAMTIRSNGRACSLYIIHHGPACCGAEALTAPVGTWMFQAYAGEMDGHHGKSGSGSGDDKMVRATCVSSFVRLAGCTLTVCLSGVCVDVSGLRG